MGTQAGSDVTLALTVPQPIPSPADIDMMGQNRKENPGTHVLLTEAISKQLAVSPSSSLRRENRHFVNPAALNATDTEACPGLCNHSIFCQQRGNKLTKLQIRFSVKWPADITKLSSQVQHSVARKESFFMCGNLVFDSTDNLNKTCQDTPMAWLLITVY